MNSMGNRSVNTTKLKALTSQVSELNQFLTERNKSLAERDVTLSYLSQEVDSLKATLQWFERPINLEKARQFEPSSETSASLQFDLFNKAEDSVDPSDDEEGLETITYKRTKKRRGSTLSDDRVKDIVVHDLDEFQRICPHDKSILKPIG